MKFNTHIDTIKSYEAGKPIELVVREFGIKPENIIKLASNENPFGCSGAVRRAIQNLAGNVHMYPDDSMTRLKVALAMHYDVSVDNIIIGAGSDQIIDFVIRTKANASSTVLTNAVTFAMYEIYAKHVGAEVIKTDSMHHDLAQFQAMYNECKPDIVFLCTPNNPTGDALDADDIFSFLEQVDEDTLVVVDGAYMEYAAFKDPKKYISPKKLLEKHKNAVYLGTFSKAYGLGGMRIGYGIGDENVIKTLYKLRPPFNITTLSLEAAAVALDDQQFVQESIAHNFEQMEEFYRFASRHGIETIESYTNFITFLFDTTRSSTQLADALLRQGIIVRDLKSYGLNAIRVTIGTEQQNRIFFAAFESML